MRASIRSAAFSSRRRRSVGARAAQAGNARCAASIAASASAGPAAGARDASAPLEFAFHPRADEPGTTLFCLKAII